MTAVTTIRVLLVEDHAMVRQGLTWILDDASDIEVIAQAGDGESAITLAETHLPDVTLMDISMPGMNGLEAANHIRQVSPATRILFLTMYADEEFIVQALRNGAAGYLVKDANAETLIEAVRKVHRGESYLSPAVSQTLIRRVVGDEPPESFDPYENLTPREKQILQLIAEAKTNRHVAKELNISIKTVQTHRANLMNKLDIHDQTSLVKYAIRRGLVRLD